MKGDNIMSMTILKRFRRSTTWIAAILVIAATVSACSRSSEKPETAAAPKQTEKVTICQGGVMAILPLIAQGQGFFDKSGVAVQLINKKDGKLALDALLAGECTFAICGEPPLVANSFKRDDYAIIASVSTNENATKIIARKDLGIKSPQDLKGKIIGARRGTLSHFFLEQFLKKNNIRSNEVTIKFLEPNEFNESLANGEIAAYSGTDELVAAGKSKLGEKALIMSEPGLCFSSISLVTRKEYAASHPESVRSLLKALILAEEFMKNRPDEAIALVQKEKGLSRADLEAILKDQLLRVTLQKTMLLTLEDHAKWMVENKVTDKSAIPNMLKIIDPKALKALNPSAVSINK